jgi:hypothetical protein
VAWHWQCVPVIIIAFSHHCEIASAGASFLLPSAVKQGYKRQGLIEL